MIRYPAFIRVFSRQRSWSACASMALILLLALALSACDSNNGNASSPNAPAKVNGFGTALNHSHSLIALPNHVLLLASHYGLFRSNDSGKSWTMVAAGAGQIMDGRMTDSLSASPLNHQRIYVLTSQNGTEGKADLGLYTSNDQGQHWEPATTNAKEGDIRLARAGNGGPDQVFIYVPKQDTRGLKVSNDAGKTFTTTGVLPFGNVLDVLAPAGQPGVVLVCGDDGVARSTDSGKTWQKVVDIKSAIFRFTTSGDKQPIYAAGDDGIYVSHDAGKSFEHVYSDKSFGELTASPVNPLVVYGKTARAIFRSKDGGRTWETLPTVAGNLQNLAPDPENQDFLYLSLSYPSEVRYYDGQSAKWVSITPKA